MNSLKDTEDASESIFNTFLRNRLVKQTLAYRIAI